MKIEITDEELQRVHEFYQRDDLTCKSGVYGGPDDTGSYSINFDVIDGEKASNFFEQLLWDKELVEYLEERAGFRVTSLNLFKAKNTDFVISALENCLDNLKN